MITCTFFGHRDAPYTIKPLLREVLLDLIEHQNVTRFFVGHQGNFDRMALDLLDDLSHTHDIRFEMVRAYWPKKADPVFDIYYTIIPEGIESVPPKYAIDYRNHWMIDHSDIIVCYVRYPVGGAAKFKQTAENKGKTVIELAHKSAP